MSIESKDQVLWNNLLRAKRSFDLARETLLSEAKDLSAIVARALSIVEHREIALNLLLTQPETSIREHFAQLVDLASVGHSDIQLVRDILLSIDRSWLVENIDQEVQKVLQTAAASEYGDYEELLRFAELYRDLDHDLFAKHLNRCMVHPNEEVHEIPSFFAGEGKTLV